MHDVRTHRSHSGTTSDEDKFLVCRKILRKEELSVRTRDGNLVPWFE